MNPDHLAFLVSREMPFGKYKGRLIADLPSHYLGWFAREGFPSGELGGLLALMYELDHNALTHLLDPLRVPCNGRRATGAVQRTSSSGSAATATKPNAK